MPSKAAPNADTLLFIQQSYKYLLPQVDPRRAHRGLLFGGWASSQGVLEWKRPRKAQPHVQPLM